MAHYFHTTDGVRLGYYFDQFTSPWKPPATVVMLHSAMGRSERWYGMVAALARHYRVVRLDMRGFGNSGGHPEETPLTMERLVQDVVELMAQVGCQSAHFIGNSAGGYVAQNLAMTHPDKVTSLVLFGSAPGLKGSNALSWLPRIAEIGLRPFLAETISQRFNMDKTDPGLIRWFLDETAKNDPAYIARFVRLMSSLDWSDQLDRIGCPTLLVIPGDEAIGAVHNYDAMRKNIRDVTTIVYEGQPHNITDADPDRCAKDALEFLQRRFPES
jgi:3-oxoadipate enol-lactonase